MLLCFFGINHDGVMFCCSFQDGIEWDFIIQNHANPAFWFSLGAKNGTSFTLSLNSRISCKTFTSPSSRQFYIGGAYSVRGYKESILSGDHGYALGVEYAVPIFNKQKNAFCFWDYGAVYGDSSFDDHILTSVGLGIKSTIDDPTCRTLVTSVVS